MANPTNIYALVVDRIGVSHDEAVAIVPKHEVGIANQRVAFVWSASAAFVPALDISAEAAEITRAAERAAFVVAYKSWQATLATIFGTHAASLHDKEGAGFAFASGLFENSNQVVDGQLVVTWARQLLDVADAADRMHGAPGRFQDALDNVTEPIGKALKVAGIVIVAVLLLAGSK